MKFKYFLFSFSPSARLSLYLSFSLTLSAHFLSFSSLYLFLSFLSIFLFHLSLSFLSLYIYVHLSSSFFPSLFLSILTEVVAVEMSLKSTASVQIKVSFFCSSLEKGEMTRRGNLKHQNVLFYIGLGTPKSQPILR